ncbi:hypothetical protein [Lacticaseibacillus absianus]|uniref:hypothetical protein n=1 Tax=Lacticaseibacillus absianus TaxID=2729623 RepID=UPI0015CEF3FA|nr:hypothetical protein [Lacticaseibacillus absianus]
MLVLVLTLLVVAIVLAAVTLAYLMTQLLTLDATARGLARPRLIGVLAAGTQNGAGLLAYLALRRSHPLVPACDCPARRERLKVASLGAFAVLLVCGVCGVLVLLSGRLA